MCITSVKRREGQRVARVKARVAAAAAAPTRGISNRPRARNSWRNCAACALDDCIFLSPFPRVCMCIRGRQKTPRSIHFFVSSPRELFLFLNMLRGGRDRVFLPASLNLCLSKRGLVKMINLTRAWRCEGMTMGGCFWFL